MDRVRHCFVCNHCGHEEMLIFYGADACMGMDGCQEDNAARERKMKESTCPECGEQGFDYKRNPNGSLVIC